MMKYQSRYRHRETGTFLCCALNSGRLRNRWMDVQMRLRGTCSLSLAAFRGWGALCFGCRCKDSPEFEGKLGGRGYKSQGGIESGFAGYQCGSLW